MSQTAARAFFSRSCFHTKFHRRKWPFAALSGRLCGHHNGHTKTSHTGDRCLSILGRLLKKALGLALGLVGTDLSDCTRSLQSRQLPCHPFPKISHSRTLNVPNFEPKMKCKNNGSHYGPLTGLSGKTNGLQSFGKREMPQYTSNLNCSTPPICTAVRLPCVPAMLLRKYQGWGFRKVPE